MVEGVEISGAEEFGIVSFRFDGEEVYQPALGDGSNDITATIRNVTITDTGSPASSGDAAGIATNAFSGTGLLTTTIENCTIRDNQNRGINARGADDSAVSVSVTGCVVEGNGYAPNSNANANGIIAQRGAEITVENSTISNVSTNQSAPEADAVSVKSEAEAEEGEGDRDNGKMTITDSRILAPVGQAAVAASPGGAGDPGFLDASGNWWGSTNPAAFEISDAEDIVDYSPFLNSGTDTDMGTPGFQGDVSVLSVDSGSPQLQAGTRIEEAVTLGGAAEIILQSTSGQFNVSTDVSVPGDLVVAGDIEFGTVNGDIQIVNNELAVEGGSVTNSPMFDVQNRFVGDQPGGNGDNAGWRLLSSPRASESAALLEDLQQANTGTILALWDDEVQEYDYINSVNGTTDLPRGESFFVYLFDLDNPIGTEASDTCTPSDACIRTSGLLNVGNAPTGGFGTNTVTVGVSDTENTSSTEAGYLLGNPFTQSFDIANLTVQSTGSPIGTDGIFEGAVTVYNPLTDEFTPVNADSNLESEVAPWQGFWLLRQPSEEPLQEETLVYEEAGRTQGAPFVPAKSTMASFNSGQLFVTLGIEQGAEVVQQSRASLYAREGASTDRDAYDLARIQPMSETFAQVSFLRPDGTRASQYSVPYALEGSVDIPLHAEGVGVSGTAHISTEGWTHIPNDWELTLTDTQTGETTPLVPGESYTFNLNESEPQPTAQPGMQSSEGEANPRFVVTAGPVEPLPVELAQFTGRADGTSAVLAWETASETNNAGFRVQRQSNGGSFETVEFVEGTGTTDAPQSYQIRVEDLNYGTHSFRIEQVDTDGTATPSDPVEVEVRLQEAMALSPVAPNPVQGQSTITMTVRETQPVQAALYDALGRRVRTLYDGELSGQQPKTLTIDASSLASGTYFVRVRSKSSIQTTRVVVVR